MAVRRARPAAPVALAMALVLGLAGCGGDEETTETPPTEAGTTTAGPSNATAPTTATTALVAHLIHVTVRGGSVEGGGRQRVSLGERVLLRVTSDTAEEVHVHGYERRVEVGAGATAEIAFVADLPGVFEVELEKSHKRLLSLEVQP